MSTNEQVSYRRVKSWQLFLAPAVTCVPTMFVVLMTFASYVAAGVYGIATVLAGTLITGSRIFDAITDPIIALFSDRLNSKFGRIRPLAIIGWVITSLAVFIMFRWGWGAGENRVLPFILIYMLYVIGYTIFNIGINMIGPVMTNEPKQRASFGRWQAVYTTVLSSTISIILSKLLMPRHNYQMGLPLFADLALFVVCASGLLLVISLVVVTIAKVDVPETYKDMHTDPVKFRDIWDVFIHNRPFQMYTIAAASDKLSLQTASQSAITVMVFGIVMGDYSFNGTLTFVNMWVTLALLVFAVSHFAGKSGMKKAVTQWTAICIGVYALMFIFMRSVDTLSITSSNLLKIVFICLFCAMGASKMACSSVTDPMRYDVIDYEMSRSGRYMPAVVNAAYSFIDKLISSLAATIVALSVATIGYTASMPQATDALTPGIFNVAMFLWLGVPILGWICTLIAMKFYKLDKETMVEVQKKNAAIKAGKAQ